MELVIARNPDEESSLGFLLLVPLGDGLVFGTSGTWPRTSALYCHPVDRSEWPDVPEVVERAVVRSCVRRGAAIDLILDRGRENRSQIVFTQARGRDAVFWQSPRTRKKARPQARTPTARPRVWRSWRSSLTFTSATRTALPDKRRERCLGNCPAATTA